MMVPAKVLGVIVAVFGVSLRNPMAIGVGSALTGAALFYESWNLAAFAGVFFLIIHLFVVLYEEPTLRRTFGDEYAAYCDAVRRWWPRWKAYRSARTR